MRGCAYRGSWLPGGRAWTDSSAERVGGSHVGVGALLLPRRLPAPFRPTLSSLCPYEPIRANGMKSWAKRTREELGMPPPGFLFFTRCTYALFLEFTAAASSIPANWPFVGTTFSIGCIARRVGRNGAGSGRKRHPLPNGTRITEEIVFSTRCSASLLCAAKCLSPLCRNTLLSLLPLLVGTRGARAVRT